MPAALAEVRLVESQPTVVQLTDDDAALLRQLGRELTSNRSWWGGSDVAEDRSIVLVDQLNIGRYKITFRDVVGVVRLPNLQINVAPKIATAHFLYIVGHSEVVPRHSSAHVNVAQGSGFIEVLARWFAE